MSSPMLITLSGRVTVSRLEQKAKASFPIVWTPFSITTVVFVLLPHIGMGIVAVLEVVKCGLQDFILG